MHRPEALCTLFGLLQASIRCFRKDGCGFFKIEWHDMRATVRDFIKPLLVRLFHRMSRYYREQANNNGIVSKFIVTPFLHKIPAGHRIDKRPSRK